MYTSWDIIDRDGVPFTTDGVCMVPGARCPHSVVDGDKPIALTGPRCGKCREQWYSEKDWYGPICPWCKDSLHVTFSPHYDGETQVYRRSSYSHGSPSLGCRRQTFPVPGFEADFFNHYGWGNWEERVAFLWRMEQEAHDRSVKMVKYELRNAVADYEKKLSQIGELVTN